MSMNPKSIGVTKPYGNPVTTFEAHGHWGTRGYVLRLQLCFNIFNSHYFSLETLRRVYAN